jgi:hypothetical protein
LVVASTIAVKLGTIAVLEGHRLALDLFALATAASVVPGSVSAGSWWVQANSKRVGRSVNERLLTVARAGWYGTGTS